MVRCLHSSVAMQAAHAPDIFAGVILPHEDAPTSEIAVLTRGPRESSVAALPPRDHASLLFTDGPCAGTLVCLRPGASLVIGRGSGAQLHIPDGNLSRQHARIHWDGDGYVIEDLGSLAGTFLDERPVFEPVRIPPGARIRLGQHVRLRADLHDRHEQKVLSELHDAAVRDPLTGAYTRRYLRERLRAELSYAARHAVPLALLMIDLDHFKEVNDRYGHPVGDAVLRVTAAQLRKLLRPEDVLVRYGGEEFCVLLRGLDETNAMLLAERLRRAVSRLSIPVARHRLHITVSIGVTATVPVDGRIGGMDEVIERADRALYQAKSAGRDACRLL